MITLDYQSKDPIYLQIKNRIAELVMLGVYPPGTQLPSVRSLAGELGINPNTIQKAYRMLEEEGLVSSHAGAKSYVVLDEATLTKIRAELLENDARTLIDAMKQMGLSKREALALIENHWN